MQRCRGKQMGIKGRGGLDVERGRRRRRGPTGERAKEE